MYAAVSVTVRFCLIKTTRCMYIQYVRMYVCMYVFMYIRIYFHIYVCMYILIGINYVCECLVCVLCLSCYVCMPTLCAQVQRAKLLSYQCCITLLGIQIIACLVRFLSHIVNCNVVQ